MAARKTTTKKTAAKKPEPTDENAPEEQQEDVNAVADEPEEQEEKSTEQNFGLSFLDPAKESHPTNAVIYGQPGSGKTGLASTAPKPLIIDLENGAPATVKAVGNEHARIIQARDMDTIRKVYKFLASGDHDFETVIIDPAGELQSIIMEETLRKFTARRQYDNLPTMQDWQKSLSEAQKIITAFRSLPLRTIVVAHADVPDHEEDVVKPLVSGKNFKPFLMGAMDLLGYLYVEQDGDDTVRKLQTQATANVVAKNRGNKLPPVVVNPNMTEIFALMEE